MSTGAERIARVSSPESPPLGIPAVVWAIAGGAVALRLIHAWLMVGDPLYDYPVVDPMESRERARYLAEVSWLGPTAAYWKPPLYDYFLALHHALFGSGLWPARISQILLDGCSCILAFALARRLSSRSVGIAVAAVIGLWGPMVYFSSVHVSVSLVIFLELCVLLLAVRAQDRPSRARWMDVGFALGLLAIARAETLLLVPWLAGWLWLSLRQVGRRERAEWVGVLALGVVVVLAPVGLRNALYADDPVLISANGGVNLFIGTEPKYRGVIGVRPGPEWELLMRAPLDRGYQTEGERSAYYVRKARSVIAGDPGRWIVHLARKFGHVWHGRELASNRDIYTARGESFVLASLLWRTPALFFPFGLLAPLALVGIAISWRQRRKSRFLIGLVAVHCSVMMLFFVTGRFRLAMLPVLVLFAAEAVSWALDCIRGKRSRALAVAAGIALLLFALTNSEVVLRSDPDAYESTLRAEEHYFRGTILGNDLGRPEEAKVELHKALELEPDFVAIAFNLAQLYERDGEYVTALRLFRNSLAITERSPAERYVEPAVHEYIRQISGRLGEDETQPEPIRRFAAGIACMDHRNWDCAIDEFRAASVGDDWKEVAPLLGLVHLARGREHLRADRDAAALSDLSDASRLRPHDALIYVELGVALTRAGQFERARWAFERFRIHDLPHGDFYRRAIESADEGDRAINSRTRPWTSFPNDFPCRYGGLVIGARAIAPPSDPSLNTETSMLHRVTLPGSRAVYWSVVLVSVLWVSLASVAIAEEDPKTIAREIYSDLVAIPSTASHGGSAEIAKYAAGRLLEAGFSEQDVQVMGPSPGAASVIARLRGRGEREPVLVVAHLDVVEALPEDWSKPPFELVEEDGYFYGRGTADNKAGAVALLANFIRLKREGFEPARDFIMLLTGDEETDMSSIAYFANEKRDLIDVAFALNSDGGIVEMEAGRPLAFVVQAAEKLYLTVRLEVRNPGGHSSRPRADNAIYELAEALLRVQAYQFPVSLNDVTRNYFRQAAQFYEPEMAAAMTALAEDRASAADIARLDSSVQLRTLMRTTCVATQLEGGHAENALPQLAAAIVNCRILPQETPDETVATVRRVIANEKVRVTVDYDAIASPPSPLTPEPMDTVVRIAAEIYPDIPVIAEMGAGATDGLYLRNAGIPTYGVSALGEDTDDIRHHGRDERVRVQAFYDCVEYWYRLLRAL